MISAAAPTRNSRSPDLLAWMDRNSDRLFLSVVTIAEIEEGIAKARRAGAAAKADRLAAWLEAVLHLYSKHVLPIDIAVSRRLGALADQARAAGHAPGFADLAIAATALVRGQTILTRNLRHFRMTGAALCDPFERLP